MKLFLVDGHALIFKMYYAFLGRPMVNTKGVDTSILFGFTKYLLEMVARERPTHLAVAFDPPGGTFRNELYPLYKANRGETPQLVIDALEPLQRIMRAMDIPVLMTPGFEADDVICSAAKLFAAKGMDVYMVTPDKDYGQAVRGTVYQYRPGKSGADAEILDSKAVCGKWNISDVSQVVDILALCGDSADNVPGVDGVGPVGAAKLLAKYGTIEGIYDHLDELSEKQREKFLAAKDHIALSKDLVTIRCDMPIDVSEEDLRISISANPEIMELLSFYEMHSLKKHFPTASDMPEELPSAVEAPAVPEGYVSVQELNLKEGMAISLKGSFLYVSDGEKIARDNPERLRSLLEDESVPKVGAGLKETGRRLFGGWGIDLRGRKKDVELIHYLLNPERSHKLESLASTYLNLDMSSPSGASEPGLFDDSDSSEDEGRMEAFAASRLEPLLWKELEGGERLKEIYETIEEPLSDVLMRMEETGVYIDPASLREFASSLRLRMEEQETLVRSIAGVPGLNVNSPKQIGEVIFEKLALDPRAKKPAGGNWPTDEQTLSELADRNPIIDAILEYRGLKKLLGTYIEPLPDYISPVDGRVHTTFNQALTSTGRLSSSNPNLQNIPVRTEDGQQIRKAFVAGSKDCVMLSADYSQIELRVMAHFCADPHMIEAFRSGEDIHASMASKIFRVPKEEVSPEQRRQAKMANFGIMYGISAFGLSQRLGCPRAEAKRLIEDYFESFPAVRGFIDDTLAFARDNGYVETLYGRRRYTPDVSAHNANVRAVAERNAVNAPIQGSAADIIKLAMIAVDRKLREGGYRARMVLQIHDELLLEVPVDEIDAVRNMLVETMEGVAELSVPLTVECNYGENWLDAH